MTEQAVLNKLKNGESLVWLGRPTQTNVIFSFDLNCILGGMIILFCSIFGITAIEKSQLNKLIGAAISVLLCVLFAFGMYCILTRLIVKAFFRSRVYYAVTDQRIMILRRTKSDIIDKAEIDDFCVAFNKRTIGSIEFRTKCKNSLKSTRSYKILSRMLAPYSTKVFLEINDVKQLLGILAQNGYGS